SARLMRSFQAKADLRSWGLGWARSEIDGVQIVSHGGATNGFTARLTVVPERQFVSVILTNHDRGSNAYGVIDPAILDEQLGLKAPKPVIVPADPEVMGKLAGTYHHDLATLTLKPIAEGLAVTEVGHNPFDGVDKDELPFRLLPTSECTFVGADNGNDGAPADFIFNPDGSVRFFRMGGRLGYPV
ncbi:MAG TPA: serine hydrolase, partial [Thermomicrobiales bacterium]|nr:serine hydrolase [Thermomicrobiales bacterium]